MQVKSLGFRADLMLRRLSSSTIEERDGWIVEVQLSLAAHAGAEAATHGTG